MPATLTARGITVSRGHRTILDDIDVLVAPGHRIGLVGPNGAGKTTLLRVLAGDLTPDSGAVVTSPVAAMIGLLPQETDATPETVRQALARRTGAVVAAAELEAAAEALAAAEPGAADRYTSALERYVSLGAADLDARSEEVVSDLGLDPAHLDRPLAALSGGQRARVALAGVLLSRFDVFLLDEPTNDLDFAGLAQLESFVTGLTSGAVIVSHDRRFLDRVVTEVVEVDDHTHRGRVFGGGWRAYLEAKEVDRRHATERYDQYQQSRSDLVSRMRTQKQWASVGVAKSKRKPKDNDKAQRDFFVNRTEKLAGKVRITEKAIERLDANATDKPWEPWQLHLSFGGDARSGDVVARLSGAVIDRGSWRMGPLDLEIGWAERVAITGPNGGGKSTLLGALLGSVPLQAGSAWQGPGVVVGSLDQARSRFAGPASLLAAFEAAAGMPAGGARSLLAKFGLGAEHVGRQAATLSPGERTRAVLALIMATSVNCLVLDEPTNHLDLPAIEQLETALASYTGTVLLVTHDRELLERVTITRRISVGAGGIVTDHGSAVA